jgi:iron complex outermembrane receptor protein
MLKKIILCFIIAAVASAQSLGQKKDASQLTRADIAAMSYDELADLSIEDVMLITKIMGISLDEFYEMLLNKNVTSASKRAESSFESPLSTTVLSYDEIIASGARNIQEAMRLVPGLIVREKTNGNYDIHIRGNNNIPDENLTIYTENTMTLVMINSRPVYNSINGGTFWESLPVDFADIDRIEIVRGAASALYGANAVTGVINIITKTPDSEDIQVFGHAQGGNLGSYMGSLSVGQNVGKFGYRVSGNYQKMNRTTDKLYVFEYDSLMYFEDVANPDFHFKNPASNWFSVWNRNKQPEKQYKDVETAVDRMGANLSLYYNVSDDINFSLSGGYQHSYVTSSSFGDPQVSTTAREMSGTYFDFIGKVKGLSLQANVLGGTQDIVRGDPGFKIDNININLNAEYDFVFGDLNIRPGVYYQSVHNDDKPYLTRDDDGNYTTGYLNDHIRINSFAGSLRVDYKMLDEKLRLIGGLRAEKFSVSDKVYIPIQLVASYNINDKHMIRGVISSANRGPFTVDTYSDYMWDREGVRPMPLKMHFEGNKDQYQAAMTMLELGYRVRPVRNVFVELEAFSNTTRDFGCLLPESMTAFVHTGSMEADINFPQIGTVHTIEQPAPAPAIPNQVNLKYQNIDLIAHQLGATVNVEWVATEKLIFKAFGTFQNTKLIDHACYNNSQIITDMTTLAAVNAQQEIGIKGLGVDNYFVTPFKAGVQQQLDAGGMQQIEAGVTQQILVQQLVGAGMSEEQAKIQSEQMMKANSAEVQAVAAQVHAMAEQAEIDAKGIQSFIAEQTFNADEYHQKLQQLQSAGLVDYDGRYEKKTITHKATPSFFGGFSVNYTPIEKLNIYASGNFYSKQTYRTSNGSFETDPKFTANMKVSYKFWKDNAVFVNARNVFGDKKQEFAWTDETRGCYLVGLDLKF